MKNLNDIILQLEKIINSPDRDDFSHYWEFGSKAQEIIKDISFGYDGHLLISDTNWLGKYNSQIIIEVSKMSTGHILITIKQYGKRKRIIKQVEEICNDNLISQQVVKHLHSFIGKQ